MKANRKEMLNILGVKDSGLKQIEARKQLNKRLKDLGYKLINKIKEGRQVFYILDQIEENKELHNKLIRHAYNTNKIEEFSDFFMMRTEGIKRELKLTNKDISEVTGISNKTICKWNKTLLDKEIISQDGFYYFVIENIDGNISSRQTTKEEYSSYWKNKRDEAIYKELEYRFNRNEISFKEAMKLVKDIGAIQAATEGKYVYRIHKYLLNTENKLYIDTYELIKQAFKDKYKSLDVNLIK